MTKITNNSTFRGYTGQNRLIYLATPYSHECKKIEQERFIRVTIVSGLLIKAGIINFSPITQSHEQNRMVNLPGHWDFWQHIDTEFLHRCDELFVLAEPGWQESTGVTAEIEIMEELGKPIHYILYDEDINEIYMISEEEARCVV